MTTDATHGIYRERLLEAVSKLRRDGWTVEVEPRTTGIPELEGYRPDFVARQGDRLIIGEVKWREAPDMDQLATLARRIAKINNAQLDVLWLGDIVEEPEVSDTVMLAERARVLNKTERVAAMLVAWSALTGAIERVDVGKTEGDSQKPARRRISELYSLGYFTDLQFDRLNKASDVRNRIAHGEYLEPHRDVVSYVSDLAERLATGRFVPVSEMVDWFLERYMDPANGVPFESQEGGYQYINGGPYDAEDVLTDNFPYATPDEIDEAVALIEPGGYEWVRSEDY